MNIAIQHADFNAPRPLAGEVSLVTGSTSGIGLGIARAPEQGITCNAICPGYV